MTERQRLLESISTMTADYREGDLAEPTPAHVDRWVRQFSEETQLPILREMNHVLASTYFSRRRVTHFLSGLLRNEKLVEGDPCEFWPTIHFLDIQAGGNSQREMRAIFGHLLDHECGISIDDCGNDNPAAFVYLDDAVFSGNRVRRDVEDWIQTGAPNDIKLHIISIAYHTGGQYYADGRIKTVAKAANKKIKITWWYAFALEDQRAHTNTSDVLRPVRIPDDEDVRAHVAAMTHQPVLRSPGNIGTNKLFSSEAGRNILEQEFLKAGVRIREMCPNLGDTQRPLGHSTLETLGFGSLIVTFRNCPNNAPLALWAGDPWYPLFARRTNSATAHERFMQMLAEDGFDVL
jgi:hypothetical protein